MKDEWKIQTIKELRQEKIKNKLLSLLEIFYSSLLPVLFTYLFFTRENFLFLLPIIFILVYRMRRT